MVKEVLKFMFFIINSRLVFIYFIIIVMAIFMEINFIIIIRGVSFDFSPTLKLQYLLYQNL